MISIVTTMYYSAPYLKDFYLRVKSTVEKITNVYEIIFVNDGSLDKSLDIALELQNSDNNLKIIDLSRNFGHHRAIMIGLEHTVGDYVFLIDCDLEERPEDLLLFWNELNRSDDLDVVYGIQNERKGKFFERLTGDVFYKIFNLLSETKIDKNLCTVRLMTRKYVQALLLHPEYDLYLAGLFKITGFNQKSILIEKYDKGKTTYTLNKKVKLVVDAITSFSAFPLRLIFFTGFIISLMTSMNVIYTLFNKLVYGAAIEPGWTSLILSIWLLCGIIIMFMGVIGIYLSKIYIEVKRRPSGIIKKVYDKTI
jgi:putative glycosyltransferase